MRREEEEGRKESVGREYGGSKEGIGREEDEGKRWDWVRRNG